MVAFVLGLHVSESVLSPLRVDFLSLYSMVLLEVSLVVFKTKLLGG